LPGTEDRAIAVKAGPREVILVEAQYLGGYAMPNFFVHMTTACNILRSIGVPVGKADFLGA